MASALASNGCLQSCPDTFPEIAYFEAPNQASKSIDKAKDLKNHPASKEISAVNGEINRLSLKQLRTELDKVGIDSRGTKDVLRKRLKFIERKRILDEADIEDPNIAKQHYTHLLVIDFEATCEEQQTKNYVHEIIEFPAVLVDVSKCEVVAEFHSFVQPVLNPILSEFCKTLTGISQQTIDEAMGFPSVLEKFEAWLKLQGVLSDAPSDLKFAVATDGPWDMARFLLMQCNVSKLAFPSWARSWINLRKVFSNFYVTKRLCLSEMLSTLGLEFLGRPHCGLDDARNIAKIAEVLVRDGAAPRVNETISHLPRYSPPSIKGNNVASVTLKEFESSERRRNRGRRSNARREDSQPLLSSAAEVGCGEPTAPESFLHDLQPISTQGNSLKTSNVPESLSCNDLSRSLTEFDKNVDNDVVKDLPSYFSIEYNMNGSPSYKAHHSYNSCSNDAQNTAAADKKSTSKRRDNRKQFKNNYADKVSLIGGNKSEKHQKNQSVVDVSDINQFPSLGASHRLLR